MVKHSRSKSTIHSKEKHTKVSKTNKYIDKEEEEEAFVNLESIPKQTSIK